MMMEVESVSKIPVDRAHSICALHIVKREREGRTYVTLRAQEDDGMRTGEPFEDLSGLV